jgi:hypothetical protein
MSHACVRAKREREKRAYTNTHATLNYLRRISLFAAVFLYSKIYHTYKHFSAYKQLVNDIHESLEPKIFTICWCVCARAAERVTKALFIKARKLHPSSQNASTAHPKNVDGVQADAVFVRKVGATFSFSCTKIYFVCISWHMNYKNIP